MFVLGLQGSPRIKGNTGILLSAFFDEAERLGARTKRLDVAPMNITPCQECGTCEKKGICPIDDGMQQVYPLLRKADIVVLATPVFFYGPTAQIKVLIDRSQTLWSRKYVHRLVDPGEKWRRGFLLSVGATKGKNLFEGIKLTAKYFFDAVGANFEDSLTYSRIESAGEISKHQTALSDAKEKARAFVTPLLNRRKILFICTENACRSQMSAAFATYYGGGRIEAESAGSSPSGKVNTVMEEVMKENGIDMAFRKPKSIEEVLHYGKPELIVSMGCGDACPHLPGVPHEEWDLPDPSGKPVSFMRKIRDEIEKRVRNLLQQ